jgi:hypothetical protein
MDTNRSIYAVGHLVISELTDEPIALEISDLAERQTNFANQV